MYTRLENKMTKEYFRMILNEALSQAEEEYNLNPESALNESFFNQLKDIKKTVVEQNVIYTYAQASERYPMGTMAVRNFYEDEAGDYPKKLSDIAWGVSYYPEMPEE